MSELPKGAHVPSIDDDEPAAKPARKAAKHEPEQPAAEPAGAVLADFTKAITDAMNAPRPAQQDEKERPSPFRSFDYGSGFRHTPHDFQPGIVVRMHKRRLDGSIHPYGNREFKVCTIDYMCRIFTVHAKGGADRSLWLSFDDCEITDHAEPLDLSDPQIALMEARRQLQIAEEAARLAEEQARIAEAQAEIDAKKTAERGAAFRGIRS